MRWVNGFRLDGKQVTNKENRNFESQGSCMPLFAQGLKFWNPEGENESILAEESICNNGTFAGGVVYELSWTRKRDKFKERPLCLTSGSDRNYDATTTCIGNCYLIPTYGKENEDGGYFPVSTMISIHQGGALGKKFENYCISDRKKYYCDGTGEVGGKDADCAKGDNRNNLPVYFTHQEWIYSMEDRIRAFGDCGYKQGLLMESSEGLDKDLESVWAVFMKLNHKGEPKDEYEIEKVYEGDFEFVEGSGYRGY